MAPADFLNLKNKIAVSTWLSHAEKKDWLYLLPRMSEEQIKELDRILSIKLPAPIPPPQAWGGKKGEVETKTFTASPSPPLTPPTRGGELKKEFLPPSWGRKGGGEMRPPALERPAEPQELLAISSLAPSDLRKATSPPDFFEKLLGRVRTLLHSGQVSPEDIAKAFLKSPLYRAYFETGLRKIEEDKGGQKEAEGLDQEEFEALADFRHDLRRLTGV